MVCYITIETIIINVHASEMHIMKEEHNIFNCMQIIKYRHLHCTKENKVMLPNTHNYVSIQMHIVRNMYSTLVKVDNYKKYVQSNIWSDERKQTL